ncbi:MAG: helix-turn-helix domain-containing protein [Mesorhizobium sp.]
MISCEQIRAARSWLGWSQEELARRSGVSRRTIVQLERGAHLSYDRTIADLRRTFEDEQIEFLFSPTGTPIGIRRRL